MELLKSSSEKVGEARKKWYVFCPLGGNFRLEDKNISLNTLLSKSETGFPRDPLVTIHSQIQRTNFHHGTKIFLHMGDKFLNRIICFQHGTIGFIHMSELLTSKHIYMFPTRKNKIPFRELHISKHMQMYMQNYKKHSSLWIDLSSWSFLYTVSRPTIFKSYIPISK